jgi:glycine cleavage system H protein
VPEIEFNPEGIMSNIPQGLKYSKDHEWVKTEGRTGTCGITDHAQHLLTDVVFVELPAKGIVVKAGDRIAVVESVKAVSDVYSPVSGTVADTNIALEESPDLVNSDPYGKGWIFQIELSNPAEIDNLMDSIKYREFISEEQ